MKITLAFLIVASVLAVVYTLPEPDPIASAMAKAGAYPDADPDADADIFGFLDRLKNRKQKKPGNRGIVRRCRCRRKKCPTKCPGMGGGNNGKGSGNNNNSGNPQSTTGSSTANPDATMEI